MPKQQAIGTARFMVSGYQCYIAKAMRQADLDLDQYHYNVWDDGDESDDPKASVSFALTDLVPFCKFICALGDDCREYWTEISCIIDTEYGNGWAGMTNQKTVAKIDIDLEKLTGDLSRRIERIRDLLNGKE